MAIFKYMYLIMLCTIIIKMALLCNYCLPIFRLEREHLHVLRSPLFFYYNSLEVDSNMEAKISSIFQVETWTCASFWGLQYFYCISLEVGSNMETKLGSIFQLKHGTAHVLHIVHIVAVFYSWNCRCYQWWYEHNSQYGNTQQKLKIAKLVFMYLNEVNQLTTEGMYFILI